MLRRGREDIRGPLVASLRHRDDLLALPGPLLRFAGLDSRVTAHAGPPLAIPRASRKPRSCHSRCDPLHPEPATPPQLVLSVSDLFLVFG